MLVGIQLLHNPFSMLHSFVGSRGQDTTTSITDPLRTLIIIGRCALNPPFLPYQSALEHAHSFRRRTHRSSSLVPANLWPNIAPMPSTNEGSMNENLYRVPSVLEEN